MLATTKENRAVAEGGDATVGFSVKVLVGTMLLASVLGRVGGADVGNPVMFAEGKFVAGGILSTGKLDGCAPLREGTGLGSSLCLAVGSAVCCTCGAVEGVR
jgi:hypothetical protein